jgi:hypothetical protein
VICILTVVGDFYCEVGEGEDSAICCCGIDAESYHWLKELDPSSQWKSWKRDSESVMLSGAMCCAFT